MVKVHIAVLMMVKNEKKRLHVTLESVKNFADSLIIYDTGSTDNTMQICKDFSEKTGISLRLKEGEFVNFETSRNTAIDFADSFEDVDYILMLDTNDELRNGDELRLFAEKYKNDKVTAFLIAQEWWSGALNKYYNSRFIKSRSNWRYKGVVHEYLANPDNKDDELITRVPESVVLFQDRTQDDDKTGKRFVRDEQLLKTEYVKDPTEPRTVFYLAQTYGCLNDPENSYYYYKIRTTLIGFYEERFHASLNCGDLSQRLHLDWYESFAWYMKAYELIPRAEPLVKIAEYYRHKENWILSFTFADLACKLSYPDHCILFIDRTVYIYQRWHLLGIVAFYAGQYELGKIACIKAIESGKENNLNIEIDESNLKIYLQKEEEEKRKVCQNKNNDRIIRDTKEHENLVGKITTKTEFINRKVIELKNEFPKLTDKQLHTRAKLLWKNKS